MSKEMNIEEAIKRLKSIKEIYAEEEGKSVYVDIEVDDIEAIETVLSMLEEKDKQIDLMAEAMRYYNGMQQKQEFCIDICEEKECNIEKCKDCIKQYYENEAKELINK